MTQSIYVGNLSFNSSEDDVRQLFEAYGAVHSVKMINDRDTGRPRGFAFVEMDETAAATAIRELDGKEFSGRTLRVNIAQDKGAGRGGGAASRGPRRR